MSGYIIIHSRLTDPERFQDYVAASEDSVNKYQGKFFLGGSVSKVLEGQHDKARTVIFEFPSVDKAQAWYNSDEYQSVKHLRDGTGEFDLVLVDSF